MSVGADVLIIDCGMGNVQSVQNAFEALGATAVRASRPLPGSEFQRIVLPGVGAFGDAMAKLRAGGWLTALNQLVIEERRPFLGICLGLQLLAERSVELGEHEGLGWLKGEVIRLKPDSPNCRVPHIGWNDVSAKPDSVLLHNIAPDSSFYFVHSYHFKVSDPKVVTGIAEHGHPFAAVIERDNIFATQFHPEKSQTAGLALLRNFLEFKA